MIIVHVSYPEGALQYLIERVREERPSDDWKRHLDELGAHGAGLFGLLAGEPIGSRQGLRSQATTIVEFYNNYLFAP